MFKKKDMFINLKHIEIMRSFFLIGNILFTDSTGYY